MLGKSSLNRLPSRVLPFLRWRNGYSAEAFSGDLLAWLTVAVVLIPQAMAYAMLAGLPPVYGLYAGAVTPMIAALWGSLRQLATGPIAIMSLLVLTTLAIWFFNLQESGIAVIGRVPEGLPGFRLPLLDLDIISALIGPAVVIALVSFAETYSVSKSISTATRQKTDVNQEFIGQGVANLVGSLFQCYPVSGSFSRTAINYAAGARTGVSSVVTSLLVIVSLLYLTPLFTLIPKAALAALVISAVLILFHPKQVFVLWRQNRTDGLVAMTVFVLALLAKPDYALLIGVMISLILFLWKTMHPRIVRETRDPERGIFLNADLHRKPGCPQILHLRSDNVIYFANAEYTVNHIMGLVNDVDGPLKFVLLDFQAISFIDMTGIEELRSLKEELEERGIRLALMAIHRPVMDTFERSGFIHELEASCYFEKGWDNEHRGDANAKLFRQIDHDYCRDVCPFSLFEECESVKLPLSAKEIPT